MWRSLLWKEWHEQRWRLWFGVALLGTFTVIGLRTRVLPDEQMAAMTIMVGGIIFPLMVAMGLVAPERAEGTIVRLFALPVPPWQVMAAKALVGGAVCAGPLVASGLIAVLMVGDREMSLAKLVGLYAMGTGVALAVFTWLTAAGVRQPSEARAGLMGVAVFVAWCLAIAVCEMFQAEVFMTARPTDWVAGASPLGFMVLEPSRVPAARVIVLQVVVAALVWGWAAHRIGKTGKAAA